MTRPRRPTRSKPRLDALEPRLVLSQTVAAPTAAAAAAGELVRRPPAMVQPLHPQLQQRPIAQPLVQVQVRPQALADAQRREAASQDPGGRQAARAAQREAARLQMEQRREQRQERQREAAANPTTTYKVHPDSTDSGGFSFEKMWKSIFPW